MPIEKVHFGSVEQGADSGDARIIGNPDAERDKPKGKGVPQLQVENLENLGTMHDLDQRSLDPNYTYRWVNLSANIKMARAKAKGYSFVDPDTEPVSNLVGESPDVKDGHYVVGDTVLMRCPKPQWKGRRAAVRKKALNRLKGPERKFRKAAEEASSNYGEQVEVITDKGD